jgi:hypothetical protein
MTLKIAKRVLVLPTSAEIRDSVRSSFREVFRSCTPGS